MNRAQDEDDLLFFPAESFNQAQSLSSDVPVRSRDGNSSGGSYTSPLGARADPVTGRKDSRKASRKKRRKRPRSLKEMIYGVEEDPPVSRYAQVFLDEEDFADPKPKLDWPGALYLDLSSPETPWYRRPSIVWFRESDLKIEDNPALQAAVQRMAPLILVFIMRDEEEVEHPQSSREQFEALNARSPVTEVQHYSSRDDPRLLQEDVRQSFPDRAIGNAPSRENEPMDTSDDATGANPSTDPTTSNGMIWQVSRSEGDGQNDVDGHRQLQLKILVDSKAEGENSGCSRGTDDRQHESETRAGAGERVSGTVYGSVEFVNAPGAERRGLSSGHDRLVNVWNLGNAGVTTEEKPMQGLSMGGAAEPGLSSTTEFANSPAADGSDERRNCKGLPTSRTTAQKWWLDHSLQAVAEELAALGADLVLRKCRGSIVKELLRIVRESEAECVFYNRRYNPTERKEAAELSHALRSRGITSYEYRSDLLVEPEEMNGFQPDFPSFFRAWMKRLRAKRHSLQPLPALTNPIRCFASHSVRSMSLDDLIPSDDHTTDERFNRIWASRVGCDAAKEVLYNFINDAQQPDRNLETHRIAPHLHFGEISPRVLYAALQNRADLDQKAFLECFCMREYAFHERVSTHVARVDDITATQRWRKLTAKKTDGSHLLAWQQGRTGFPVVDAVMRQLRIEGWCHGRLLTLVATFFVKYLLLPWQEGVRHIQNLLLDSELSSVGLKWALIADHLRSTLGSAQLSQANGLWRNSERSKKLCRYVRKFVPELANLPDHYLLRPWLARQEVLAKAAVQLVTDVERQQRMIDAYTMVGSDPFARGIPLPYPMRIVNPQKQRRRFYNTCVLWKRLALLEKAPRLVQGRGAETLNALYNGHLRIRITAERRADGSFVLPKVRNDDANSRGPSKGTKQEARMDTETRAELPHLKETRGETRRKRARTRKASSHRRGSGADESRSRSYSVSCDATSASSTESPARGSPSGNTSGAFAARRQPQTLQERRQKLEEMVTSPKSSGGNSETELFRAIALNVLKSYEITDDTDRSTSRDSVRLCILKDHIRRSNALPVSLRVTVNHIKEFFKALNLQVTGEWDRRGHGGVRGPYVYGLRPKVRDQT